MRRLDALVHRRRRMVLAAWAVVLLAALPLAAHQSDRLTGGGFGVPGSHSDRVEKAVASDFDRTKAATLGAVLMPARGARRRDAAVGRWNCVGARLGVAGGGGARGRGGGGRPPPGGPAA